MTEQPNSSFPRKPKEKSRGRARELLDKYWHVGVGGAAGAGLILTAILALPQKKPQGEGKPEKSGAKVHSFEKAKQDDGKTPDDIKLDYGTAGKIGDWTSDRDIGLFRDLLYDELHHAGNNVPENTTDFHSKKVLEGEGESTSSAPRR